MFKTSLVTTALLAFLLSACGGGESTIAGDTSSDTDTDTDTDTGSVSVSAGLGAGVDDTYQPGALTLSSSNVLTGGFISITANGVNENDSNSALTDATYQYTFESVCSTASSPSSTFSTTVTFSAEGEATTNYFNNGCLDSDVITAKLFNQLDNSATATPLATATATIRTADPQLGFGSGVDYRDGLISGELDLVDVAETTLTANAVNTLSLNSLVTSSSYVATWSSDCATASFSIPSQTLENSTIQTRYDTDIDNCIGENRVTLTLTLASDSNTILDSTTTIVNVSSGSSGGDVVIPSLGTGVGGEFREGELALSVSRIVTGNSLTITSDLVDKNSSNAQLTSAYQYVFTSGCVNPAIPDGETEAPAATASFTLTNTVNSSGTVSTVYTPFGSGCAEAGTDTVTLSVYESTATPGTDDALATASSSIQIANPKLGSGSGSSFRSGEVGGADNGVILLTGTQETLLTADVVNPLDANSAISSSDLYRVEWSETIACSGDTRSDSEKFSVQSQTLSNTIETRYTAGDAAPTCTNTEVSVGIYLTDGSEVLDSMKVAINLQESSTSSAIPDLGTGNGDDFIADQISLSNTNVLIGTPVTVTVDLVDSEADNALLAERYQFNFTSSCDTSAAFSRANVISSTGTATTTYTPSAVACATGDVTMAVQLVDLVTDTNIDGVTATATLNATLPKLGDGTGADFTDLPEDFEVVLTGTDTIVIAPEAVDPLDSNALIASDGYEVRWEETTSCSGDTRLNSEKFSVESQLLSNAIETRYTAGDSAPACTSTEVTLSLYLAGGSEVLDALVFSMTLEEAGTTSAVPDLGFGSGDDFIADQISLSSTNVLIGEPVTVTVNLVDSDADNALLAERYQFNFSSSCGSDASFSRDSLISGTGTASVTYTSLNRNCSSDTITVGLTDLVTGVVAGVTASDSLSVTRPLLGNGEGAQFRVGEVEGEVNGVITLTGTNETLLAASAVDPQNANSTLNSALYEVRWTEDTLMPATCTTAGSFSVQTQTLSSTIETRYSAGAEAPTCTSTNVIASLYLFGGSDVLDSMSVNVNLEEGSGGAIIDPALGARNGEEFNEGTLELSIEQVLVGSSTLVTVNGVDKNDGNNNLDEQYQYTFESICSAVDTADFSISKTFSTSNIVSSTYRNRSCESGDTITVKLFEADADAATATALSTAEFDIDTAKPLLGNGSGAAYIDGVVSGSLELSGDTTTDLLANAVNPLDSNSIVDDENYVVEWSTDCTTGSFSVEKQDLEGGSIETRYTTDLVNCLGDNNLSLALYEKTRPSEILDQIDFIVEVQEGVAPDLGTGTGDTFDSGVLDINPDSISAAGTALVSINIVDTNDNNALINNRSYGLTATSLCAEQVPAQASFNSSEQITAQGSVSFTYIASGCVGDDTVTITLYDVVGGVIDLTSELATATGEVTVASAEVGAITYSGATASSISISTIGDAVLPKQSLLTFVVVDKSNNPVEGQTVEFSLSNSTGGVELASSAEVTDSNGEVSAIMNSGSSHVVTSVVARTQVAGAETESDTSDDVYIQTSSQPISITTGIADQDSFTVAAETLNPGAFDVDGVTVAVSVFAADQYQNPVADGTVVNFTAESGFIQSNCLTSGGTCSVTWTSSGVRPGKHDPALERVNDLDPQESTSVLGMTTIMAYTTGESGYTDQNGNGQFDYIDRNGDGVFSDGDGTEPYLAYAEAFRDDNWDGVLDTNADGPVEFFADFNEDGEHSSAPGFYQGVVCSTELQDIARLQPDDGVYDAHCKYMMHVQSSVRIIQSWNEAATISLYTYDGGTGVYTLVDGDDTIDASLGSFFVFLQDSNGNIPASGTNLSITGDGFDISGDSGSVNNSIGLLYEGIDNNLPSFGELYRVGFVQDGTPVSIEISVTLGSATSGIVLDALTDGSGALTGLEIR